MAKAKQWETQSNQLFVQQYLSAIRKMGSEVPSTVALKESNVTAEIFNGIIGEESSNNLELRLSYYRFTVPRLHFFIVIYSQKVSHHHWSHQS